LIRATGVGPIIRATPGGSPCGQRRWHRRPAGPSAAHPAR